MNKFTTFITIITLLLVSLTTANASNAQQSPVGFWKTIDDVTGRAKSILEISEKNGKLKGRVVKILPNQEEFKICTACEGKRHNQRILGMVLMEGLTKDVNNPGQWSNGEILDPRTGKTYHCSIQLVDKGQKLKVRGYLGISLFGRTQTWKRVEFTKTNGKSVALQ